MYKQTKKKHLKQMLEKEKCTNKQRKSTLNKCWKKKRDMYKETKKKHLKQMLGKEKRYVQRNKEKAP